MSDCQIVAIYSPGNGSDMAFSKNKKLKRIKQFSMEDVASELQCPICLEFFTFPIILPCSHILCQRPCAERLFQDDFVKCPVCRDNSFVTGGLEALPRVISLENIIERYKENGIQPPLQLEECGPDDIPCQLCEGTVYKAKSSCLDCNASYCQKCLNISHPDREPFSEHQLVKPRRYPKPHEPRCELHDMNVNIYCQDCQTLGCLLCADDPNAHPAHRVLGLQEAVQQLRVTVEANLHLVEDSQEKVSETIRSHQRKLNDFQSTIEESRCQINEQCDSLISEIESKRQFFISDIEYEESSRSQSLETHIADLEAHNTNLTSLIHFTREVIKENDKCAFLQLAKSVNDKIKKSLSSTVDLQSLPPITALSLNHKIVDLRKEKTILKDMGYLSVPSTPEIEVDKCSRSTSSVVLVLAPPVQDDVLDGYLVFYCSESQKRTAEQEKMIFKTPKEERKCGRGLPMGSAVCLIHNNLESDTMYYFCVRAYNASGQSDMSDIINCKTLSVSQIAQPVPEIVEAQCRSYTHSIQIYSPSPVDAPDSEISHYLLYREASADKIWKSTSMFGRLDHRVFGLDSDTSYDFVVMACYSNGECQVSNSVTLRTERGAY